MKEIVEFDEFIADVLSAAPLVAEEMQLAGDPVEPDMEIPVLWVGSVGHGIVASFERLDETQRRGVFDAVERHLTAGSELLDTAITTGLLEVVSEAVDRGRLDAATVAALLGQRSRTYVDAWDDFSLGKSTLGPT